jgi:hypothetical protein
MKDESADPRSPLRKFDDAISECIDSVDSSLTVAEVVGTLELQLHVLKNRMMGYKQATTEKP